MAFSPHDLLTGNDLHGARAHNNTNDTLGVGSPVARITPAVIGQLFLDETLNILWVSTGLTSADWKIAGGGGGGFLFSEGSEKTTNAAVFTVVNTFTIPAKTLAKAGDSLIIEHWGFTDPIGAYAADMDLGATNIWVKALGGKFRLSIEIVRYTNVTWRASGLFTASSGITSSATFDDVLVGGEYDQGRFAGTDDLDTALVLRLRARNTTTADFFHSEGFRVALGSV